jgi:hypothetical protein
MSLQKEKKSKLMQKEKIIDEAVKKKPASKRKLVAFSLQKIHYI